MFDYDFALMAGTDIPILELQLTLKQPNLTQIAMVGTNDFFIGLQCLAVNKMMLEQDKTLLDQTNNFQIFMTIMNDKTSKDKKEAVLAVLSLIFPGQKVLFTPRSMVIETATVDENNFELLQTIIKRVFCLDKNVVNDGFNPGNAKAKEIADKIMRGRQIAAAEKGEGRGNIFTQYTSILTVGLHLPLQECLKLTMYQLMDLVERYMLFTNWDLDVRSRLAGAKGEGKLDNWMKNIH